MPEAVVRLDARRLRVYVDVQLDDDREVLVLVLADGTAAVEVPAIDLEAARRAALLLAVEAQSFADRIEAELTGGSGSTQ